MMVGLEREQPRKQMRSAGVHARFAPGRCGVRHCEQSVGRPGATFSLREVFPCRRLSRLPTAVSGRRQGAVPTAQERKLGQKKREESEKKKIPAQKDLAVRKRKEKKRRALARGTRKERHGLTDFGREQGNRRTCAVGRFFDWPSRSP